MIIGPLGALGTTRGQALQPKAGQLAARQVATQQVSGGGRPWVTQRPGGTSGLLLGRALPDRTDRLCRAPPGTESLQTTEVRFMRCPSGFGRFSSARPRVVPLVARCLRVLRRRQLSLRLSGRRPRRATPGGRGQAALAWGPHGRGDHDAASPSGRTHVWPEPIRRVAGRSDSSRRRRKQFRTTTGLRHRSEP
jgi:hypothetical protein